MTTLSIIIPVYFSEHTIYALVQKLVQETTRKIPSFEIVLVNDGSTDGSDGQCKKLSAAYPEIVVYARLSKNFGEHNAVMAGLNICRGDYAVIIDDDFQNPPEEIQTLYKKITETGVQVVYSYYASKKHHWFRNLGSAFNDRVATIILDKPKGLYLSSFKIVARPLINEIIKYTGPYPYIDGLILRATDNIATQLVAHQERKEGKSNYTLKKLIKLWSNMVINFSLKPLRWSMYIGFLFSALGFFLAVYFIFEKLDNPNLPMGWPAMMVCLTTFSGVQLLVLGVIGEFLGRMYLSNNATPQYAVAEVQGLTKQA